MSEIHPTAIVDPDCQMGDDVRIGPSCVIEGKVVLGDGVRLVGHVYLKGPLTLGARTQVYPFACLGFPGQDFKFGPDDITAGVVIGADCILREHVTVHAATNDHTPTRIGNRVFMMGTTHVAHDCDIGDRVVMVNGAGVAGHTVVGEAVNFGGNAVVHQHCRIGRMAMISGDCAVSLDVPPFCMVNERNRMGGLNLVGLRRGGMDRDHITTLRRAFREALREPMPRPKVVEILERLSEDCPPVAELAEFVRTTKRGITPGLGRGTRGSRVEDADEG